jgi:hypothetical protein
MSVYRLDLIEPSLLSWQFSDEKDTVWTCAPTAKRARDLLVINSGFAKYGAKRDQSPWQDEATTSCAAAPSLGQRAASVFRGL